MYFEISFDSQRHTLNKQANERKLGAKNDKLLGG